MAADAPFYPINGGGIRGWLFRQIFGGQIYQQFSQNYILNKNNPVWVDVDNLLGVYMQVPHLRAVIDLKAEMFSNARFCVKDKSGKEIENHPILAILKNPNPLQGQEQFMAMFSIYMDIYNQNFTYKLAPTIRLTDKPKALWHLPPYQMKIVPTGKIWQQFKIEEIIDRYELMNSEGGGVTVETFRPDQIIHFTKGISNKYIVGESKIVSLQKPLSNIVGALRTRNCIIYDRGALGMLSADVKDNVGAIPLGDIEKKRIENQMMSTYGIQDDQMRTIITTASLKYTPMTFPTKDLMLFEEIEDDFAAICSTYGMSRDLFPSTKGATYENQRQALIGTYQNTIQPFADWFCSTVQTDPFFAPMFKNGEYLEASYDWMPIMQSDKSEEANARKTNIDAIRSLVDSNIVTPLQARKIVTMITGIEPDESMASTSTVLDRVSELSPLVSNNLLGTLTINEARGLLGLPPVPNGDVLMDSQPTPTPNENNQQ